MLNRRILRAKVMQSLYALKQAEASNYHQSHDTFKDFYAPDLNSMDVQDPVQLEVLRKQASQAFDKNFEAEKYNFEQEPIDMRKLVLASIESYRKSVLKDTVFFKNLMLDTTERLFDLYIYSLAFPIDLHQYLLNGEDTKTMFKIFGNPEPDFFSHNYVFQLLLKNPTIDQIKIRKNLKWEKEILRKTLLEYIVKDEAIKGLLVKQVKTTDEQKELINQVFKKLFFQNQYVQEYFEENEVNWLENKSIIKSMVSKTIKSIKEDTDEIEIVSLSANWEEDKEFAIELYNKTLQEDKYLEGVVSEKSLHWDIERVAALDKIILKMALAEMIHFPSIPVKVTINEYIELSKTYSTPKSKQFINGILDKLSEEFISQGLIKKSGRGLIDNK